MVGPHGLLGGFRAGGGRRDGLHIKRWPGGILTARAQSLETALRAEDDIHLLPC
jgi:hypothetical protein